MLIYDFFVGVDTLIGLLPWVVLLLTLEQLQHQVEKTSRWKRCSFQPVAAIHCFQGATLLGDDFFLQHK